MPSHGMLFAVIGDIESRPIRRNRRVADTSWRSPIRNVAVVGRSTGNQDDRLAVLDLLPQAAAKSHRARAPGKRAGKQAFATATKKKKQGRSQPQWEISVSASSSPDQSTKLNGRNYGHSRCGARVRSRHCQLVHVPRISEQVGHISARIRPRNQLTGRAFSAGSRRGRVLEPPDAWFG